MRDPMYCPVCSTTLQETALEANLRAYACQSCRGHFIISSDYLDWREQQVTDLPANPDPGPLPKTADTMCAKRCPLCQHVMLRYRVDHAMDFGLDHCGNCNSVWFDRNEWNNLKCRHLHDDVNRMFTTAWQRRIREVAHRATMQSIYRERFGESDYTEVQRVRVWLEAHPQRSALLAYLNANDPYE